MGKRGPKKGEGTPGPGRPIQYDDLYHRVARQKAAESRGRTVKRKRASYITPEEAY